MITTNNLFKITFFVSLILHSLIFIPLAKSDFLQISKQNSYLVTYYKIKAAEQVKNITPALVEKEITITKTAIPKIEDKEQIILKEKVKPKPAENKTQLKEPPKEIEKKQAKAEEDKKEPAKPLITKQANTPEELANDKSYIAYYDLVNQKLRQSVFTPQNFAEGEISLTFVVASDGTLRDIEVIQNDRADNPGLKETAMQIVKKASPFPPFPEDIRKMQLTFNVVIYFCDKF